MNVQNRTKITRMIILRHLQNGLAAVTFFAATAFSTAAAAENTLEKIQRTGEVTVGTEAVYPPFEFVEDGKIVGYGKDILDYMIADMGVELTQLDLP